jgi:hypothetical protein
MSDLAPEPQTPEEDPKFVTQTFGVDEMEDYAEDRAGVPIRCQYCVGQSFRRSRLRSDDVRSIFLMRYPVRCLRCAQRQLVSFTLAGISLPANARTQRRRRPSQQMAGGRRSTDKPLS